MFLCKKCNIIKSDNDFYKSLKNRHWCKQCHKEYTKKYYKTHIGYSAKTQKKFREKHPGYYKKYQPSKEERKTYAKIWRITHKISANNSTKKWRMNNKNKHLVHNFTQTALYNGKLIKKPCCICGNSKSQAHHEDYNKPLNIIWFCQEHHSQRHIELKNNL
jgi:hypothetical protein